MTPAAYKSVSPTVNVNMLVDRMHMPQYYGLGMSSNFPQGNNFKYKEVKSQHFLLIGRGNGRPAAHVEPLAEGRASTPAGKRVYKY